MGSVTCGSCGFVSFATSEVCKQCGTPFPVRPAHGQPEQTQQDYNQPSHGRQPYGRQSQGRWATPGQPFAANEPQPESRRTGQALVALLAGLGCIPAAVAFGILLRVVGAGPLAAGLAAAATFGVLSVLAVALGISSVMKTSRRPAEYGGKGMAVSGIVLGSLALVSVVPIGVIGAIAIPNLLASKRAANEASALATVRELAHAQEEHASASGGYATLGQLVSSGAVEKHLADGVHNGYRFEVVAGSDSFEVTAVPTKYADTGTRSFYYSSDDSVMRAADLRGRKADATADPLGELRGPASVALDAEDDTEERPAPPRHSKRRTRRN
jgi:type IV pilus assembly protein PilA